MSSTVRTKSGIAPRASAICDFNKSTPEAPSSAPYSCSTITSPAYRSAI